MADAQENVVVRFMAVDVDKVKASFATVEDLCAKLENRVAKLVKTSSTAASGSTKSVETSSKELEKSLDKATKVVDKSAREQVKAVEKAERDKQKAFEKTQKVQEKINAAIVKNAQRAGNEEAKAIKKVNDERIKAEQKAAANVSKSRRSLIGDTGSRAMGTAGRVLGGAGKLAAGVIGVGGSFSAVDSIRASNDAQLEAIRYENNSKDKNTGIASVSKDTVMKRASELSQKWGVGQADVVRSMATLQAKTGKADIGLNDIGDLLEISKATGADIGEVSKTYGSIGSANKDFSKEERLSVLRTLVAQGAEGGVEIKSLGDSAVKTLARSGSFKGDRASNLSTLGGLIQMSETTAGSSEMASTSTNAFFSDIGSKSKDLKKIGANVWDKDGKMKSAKDTVMTVMDSIGGNDEKASAIFGEQGMKTYTALNNVMDSAQKQAESGGKKLSKEEIKEVRRKALEGSEGLGKWDGQASKTQIKESANAVMASNTERLNKAMETLRIGVGEKLVPAFTNLIPILEKLIPYAGDLAGKFVDLANFIANNPLNAALIGAGAIITKSAAEAIGGALIQSTIKDGLGSALKDAGKTGGALFAAAALAAWLEYLYVGVQSGKKTQKSAEDTRTGIDSTVGEVGSALATNQKITQEDVDKSKNAYLKLKSLNNETAIDAANRAKAEGGGIGGALWVAGKHQAATPEQLQQEAEAKRVYEEASSKLALQEAGLGKQDELIVLMQRQVQATIDLGKGGGNVAGNPPPVN